MNPFKQPDKNLKKPSAKALSRLPIAQPAAPKSPDTSSSAFQNALNSLEQDGYAILPATLFPAINLDALLAASERLTAAARTGSWPYIRTLPKQFPPWTQDAKDGIWGVQHLLHPSNPEFGVFAQSYFDQSLVRCASVLVGCSEDELCMELYNLLVRPDKPWELRWHRDDIPADASPAEEEERLGKKGGHAQWNLALLDDESLVVVPGSHRRARTDAERAADPYAPHIPGQVTVKLKAGEVVFYDNNILHRGVYDQHKERYTLHGSMGTGGQRARNVLQHGVGEWVGECRFEGLGECEERAGRMRGRLVELGSKSGDVGFFAKEE